MILLLIDLGSSEKILPIPITWFTKHGEADLVRVAYQHNRIQRNETQCIISGLKFSIDRTIDFDAADISLKEMYSLVKGI